MRTPPSPAARLIAALLAVGLAGGVSACGSSPAGPGSLAAGPGDTPSGSVATPTTGASPTRRPVTTPTPAPKPPSAPKSAFAVGVRHLSLSRGSGRPLPTTVWYPATGKAGGDVRDGAKVAPGRFPVVLFSHGLHGLPEYYQQITTRWAAAGFVVAAPAYPFTNNKAAAFNASDMGNQPADGTAVITAVLKLNAKSGDPLAGHLNTAKVACGGHSAGGFTTVGMLSGSNRDKRLKAGIVIAGGQLGGAFTGPAASVLVVHGDADQTVPIDAGRAAYNALSWPKAFLTLLGGDHGSYLGPGAKGFNQVIATTVDFLRWTLYDDAAARKRLAGDAARSGVSSYKSSKL